MRASSSIARSLSLVACVAVLGLHCVESRAALVTDRDFRTLAKKTAALLKERDELRVKIAAAQAGAALAGAYRSGPQTGELSTRLEEVQSAILANYTDAEKNGMSEVRVNLGPPGEIGRNAMTLSYITVGVWLLAGILNVEAAFNLLNQAVPTNSVKAQAELALAFAIPIGAMANFFYVARSHIQGKLSIYDRWVPKLAEMWARLRYGHRDKFNNVFLKELTRRYEPLTRVDVSAASEKCRVFITEENADFEGERPGEQPATLPLRQNSKD